MIKIANINVNGIRAATLTGKSAKFGNGLKQWIDDAKPDILAIQELKAKRNEISEVLEYLNVDESKFYMQDDLLKKGHAGVGVIIFNDNLSVIATHTPFENISETEKYLTSGRYIEIDIELNSNTIFKNQNNTQSAKTLQNCTKPINSFKLINTYIHHADSPTATRRATKLELENGSKKDVQISFEQSKFTMDNKHHFMQMITKRLRELNRKNCEFIMVGDYNIAHTENDIKNYAGNTTKAGFLPEERAWLDLWLSKSSDNCENNANLQKKYEVFKYNEKIDYSPPTSVHNEFKIGGLELFDVCRDFWGQNKTHFTWWTYMGRAFDNDAGWRIDYQFASKNTAKCVKNIEIHKQSDYSTRWSDHAPLVVEYNF